MQDTFIIAPFSEIATANIVEIGVFPRGGIGQCARYTLLYAAFRIRPLFWFLPFRPGYFSSKTKSQPSEAGAIWKRTAAPPAARQRVATRTSVGESAKEKQKVPGSRTGLREQKSLIHFLRENITHRRTGRKRPDRSRRRGRIPWTSWWRCIHPTYSWAARPRGTWRTTRPDRS